MTTLKSLLLFVKSMFNISLNEIYIYIYIYIYINNNKIKI